MQQSETTVKSYSTPQAFQRDQQFLAMQGWQVMNTTSVQPRAGLGRIALIGLGAFLFKPKPQIIVTYQRIVRAGQLQQPPRRLTLREQIEIKKEERRKKYGF